MFLLMAIGMVVLCAIIYILLYRKNSSSYTMLLQNHTLVNRLKRTGWFHSYWKAGLFLFMINALLFMLTIAMLWVSMYNPIPFLHLIVMGFAVIASIYVWIIVEAAWQGAAKDRKKLAMIGSSFYFMLSLLCVYMYVTVEPSYPGEDPFMRALVWFFGLFVSLIAFLACFAITGFSRAK